MTAMDTELEHLIQPFGWVEHTVTVPGEPWPKARPRRGKHGNVYTTREDHDREALTAAVIRSQIPEPLRGNLTVGLIFYRRTLRKVDADNLIKHVFDASNGTLFLDDSQVTAGGWSIQLDRENPRTVLLIGPHQFTDMIRGG